jgi:Ca2+-binding EF-hand superfamily protein
MKRLLMLAAASLLFCSGLSAPGGAAELVSQQPAARPLRGDSDGDRRLSLEEYLTEAGRRFERFDRNRDGGVQREEVEALASEIAAGIKARMLRRFAREDADADGTIKRAEADGFAAARFSALDHDGDGRLAAADLRRRAPTASGAGESP